MDGTVGRGSAGATLAFSYFFLLLIFFFLLYFPSSCNFSLPADSPHTHPHPLYQLFKRGDWAAATRVLGELQHQLTRGPARALATSTPSLQQQGGEGASAPQAGALAAAGGDGPCAALLAYMRDQQRPPPEWQGFRALSEK